MSRQPYQRAKGTPTQYRKGKFWERSAYSPCTVALICEDLSSVAKGTISSRLSYSSDHAGFVVMCTHDRELHSSRAANYPVGRTKVTQVITGKILKEVYDVYKPHFPDSMFSKYALKEKLAGEEGGGA
jgi:hypothetical protein